MRLSACIVINNEEVLLPRCLESIKKVVDEIIVVHDGVCKDKSLQIAKKFGAKIFVRPYIGEAEYHRPFSYEKANGEWILQIDADEFLPRKEALEIQSLINSKRVDAYSFYWPYPQGNDYVKSGPFANTFKPCLFRKSKMYMIGISHEYPRTYGKLVKKRDFHLGHSPLYNNFLWKALKTKWKKWAVLQAKQINLLEKSPTFNIVSLDTNSVFNHYKNMRRFPICSGIIESVKFIFIYIKRGIFFAGIYSIKIALMELIYIWMVRVFLLSYKYGKRL